MKNLLAGSHGVICGEIDVLPGDRTANEMLRRAAEMRAIPVFTHPAAYWEGVDHDKRLQRLTGWLIEIGANIVVTSAQRSVTSAHQEVGRMATQAAVTASLEMSETITVLEGHGANSRQGGWTPATDGYSGLVMPQYPDAPNADTTYTRSLINPAGIIATSSAELLMATGEI